MGLNRMLVRRANDMLVASIYLACRIVVYSPQIYENHCTRQNIYRALVDPLFISSSIGGGFKCFIRSCMVGLIPAIRFFN
jgi:hypothetical protein